MNHPKPNETREAFLVRLAAEFINEYSGYLVIQYDEAECDGGCLAGELMTEVYPALLQATAAPEMLEALEKFLAQFSDGKCDCDNGEGDCVFCLAEKAVKKARGE